MPATPTTSLFVHRFADGRHHRRDGLLLLGLVDRAIRRASATPISPRCAAWCRRWGSRSRARRWREIAGTLVEVYLGRDAGQRVLSGRIQRGVADRIEAVLWFSDLRSFTTITDTARPNEIIPLLNDYADAVITAIHEAGGDVLKLIGDGTLAHLPRRRSGRGLRQRARRPRPTCARRVQRAQRAAQGRGAADHLGLCRPAYRRGVLRQYRQRRPARLHRGRARRSTRPAASPRCAARSTGRC